MPCALSSVPGLSLCVQSCWPAGMPARLRPFFQYGGGEWLDRDRNAKSRHFPPGPSRTASGRWLRAMPQACALGSRFPHRCSGMSRRGGLGRVQPGLTPGAPCARWPDQCGEPQWGQEGRGLFCASPEGPGVWSSRGFPTPALPVSREGGTRGRPSVTPTLPGPVGAECVWPRGQGP